jgi:4'-phosphopantetheinyl transferase
MSAPSPARPTNNADRRHDWPLGPRQPRLAAGAVHVWHAELNGVSEAVAEALSDDERQRAARIASAGARRDWCRARGLLRELIGRYLKCDAAAVQLTTAANGKPELVDAGEDPALFFNLSHSRELALYAFGVDAPLGVDVQVARDRRASSSADHVALARRAFGEHEAQRLSLVEPARREREFLRAWTSYEAELKRRGTGIGNPDVARGATAWAQIAGDPDAAPCIVELDVGANAAAALALQARTDELRCWSYA